MKKIVCELCEGMEFVKEGGMFVCQGCGTKYSAEEARNLMREVGDAAPAPAAAPAAAPAVNPVQQQVENMLLLATNAIEANNNQEAENYCNQIIALDASSYKAWLLKGKAAGWQSTLKNQRITEAAHAFSQAIDFAPEDEKEAVKEEAVEELKRLGIACINLRKNMFAKYPDDEELAGFGTDRMTLLNALLVLLSKGIVAGIPKGYEEEIASIMNLAAVEAFTMVRNRYNEENKPDRNDFNKALTQADNCVKLIQRAIDASKKDDGEDITRYNNMIIIYEYTINMKAYANYSDYSPTWQLTDAAKNIRRNEIASWKVKIEEAKIAAARKKKERIEAYWNAHAEEKAALEAEKNELREKQDSIEAQLREVIAQIDNIKSEGSVSGPLEAERDNLKNQIDELIARRSKLGIFAGKEKKQLAEQIAALEVKKDSMFEMVKAEKEEKDKAVNEKLAPFNARRDELLKEKEDAVKRIAEIDAEFTKERDEEE